MIVLGCKTLQAHKPILIHADRTIRRILPLTWSAFSLPGILKELQSSRDLLNKFKAVLHLSNYLVNLANKLAIDFILIYFRCFGGKRAKVR